MIGQQSESAIAVEDVWHSEVIRAVPDSSIWLVTKDTIGGMRSCTVIFGESVDVGRELMTTTNF